MKKKTAITLFQVLVTVGTLGWIFHDPKKRADMWDAISHDLLWSWIFAGIAAYGVVLVLSTARWEALLRVQGIRIPWHRLFKLLMIGIFFNQLMPGATGGDVVKTYYLFKETPGRKVEAALAVLMDRVLDIIGLIFVAATVIIWKWDWLTQGKPAPHFEWAWLLSFSRLKDWVDQIPHAVQLLYLLLLVLGGAVIGIAASFIFTGTGLVERLPAKFPKRAMFVDLCRAYHLYAHAWKASLLAIVISFAVHIFLFLSFYAAARAIHVKIPLLEFCAVMPVINTLASLPISVGGAGVREGLFITMLPTLTNVTGGDATVISILGYSMMVFWGICGSLVYLSYRHSEEKPQ